MWKYKKKVLELSKLYVVVAESCNFFFFEKEQKICYVQCSSETWKIKKNLMSSHTLKIPPPSKKRKKYRIIHKIPCSMYFGILEERKGSGLWTKGETKQTTNTWRLKTCALIAPIPKRKSLRWKTQEGKEKPTLISDH